MHKSILISTATLSLGLLMGLAVNSDQSASASTRYYTNPSPLRHHKYWYSYSPDYVGKWAYNRIHFAKHSVYMFNKTRRSGKWHKYHINAKHYYVNKHNGWYTFGTRNSDNVYHVKLSWRYLNNKRHWTLGMFDPSNNNGGYQPHAPYTVWTYTTYLNSGGWYHELNSYPKF